MAFPPLLLDPLNKLPEHVNTVVIQIGKVFRESSQRDLKAISYGSKGTAYQTISKASCHFHEALDEIEIHLLKAKAIMERDLAMLRNKRAEREKANGALRLHDSTVRRKLALDDESAATDDKVAIENISHKTAEPVQEITHDNAVVDDKTQSIKFEMPLLAPSEKQLAADELHSDNDIASDDKPQETLRSSSPADAEITVRVPSPVFDTNLLNTQDTDQLSDADFDSMFADTSDPNNNDSLNFDLDFSGDTSMSLHDDPFVNLDANHDFPNTSAENIDSLMPGIENYVNESSGGNVNDNYTTLEMPAAITAALDSSLSTKPIQDGEVDLSGINTATEPPVIATAPATSNFDDLFFDDAGGMDMGDGDISGEFVDFDDDWFKSDGL
ncbi:hypothetical protein MMC13_003556 [Lambiella insularis]|nr:hypothetical protein [Lambiella insularis]